MLFYIYIYTFKTKYLKVPSDIMKTGNYREESSHGEVLLNLSYASQAEIKSEITKPKKKKKKNK